MDGGKGDKGKKKTRRIPDTREERELPSPLLLHTENHIATCVALPWSQSRLFCHSLIFSERR